jgi:hypothetical protein
MSTEDDQSNYIRIPGRPAAATNTVWSFNEPVIVRPTAQAIAAGTEAVLGSSLAENTPCAICQDTILSTDSARRLVACGHVYHRGCIDEWFRRSVYCPSCRHDIRLPSVGATPAASLPPQQQQPLRTPEPRSPAVEEGEEGTGRTYFS